MTKKILWINGVVVIGIIFLIFNCNGEKKKAQEETKMRQIENDFGIAESVGTLESYEGFLKKHPKSIYTDEVNTKIKELQELSDWAMAEDLNTIEDYNQYLSKYPKGKYVNQAKGYLNSLILNPEELDKRYEQVDSLIRKFKIAKKLPAGFKMPSIPEMKIILVPQTKRLLYIQEILFPELKLGYPDTQNKLYIVYNYKRGESLQWEYNIFTNEAVTSAIIFNYRLIAEIDNDFYLIEKKEKYAGVGCTSLQHLIYTAVAKFDFPDTLGEEVKNILEAIIGYAIGFDGVDTISINQKLSLLKFGLTSEYWADRDLAKENLLKIADKKALKFFISELHNENKVVRQTAIEILGNIRDNRAVDSLITCLNDRDNKIKLALIDALGKIADRKAVESVAVCLSDKNLNIRRQSAWALAQMNDNRGLTILIDWLKDAGNESRSQAALALARLKDKRAVVPLINCLKKAVILDPYGTARDVDLIKYTAEAITAIGDTSAVGPLIKLLKDYPELSDIVDALKKLTGQDFGDSYEEWLKWRQSHK